MKITFKVKGMHCKSCEILIKDSLEDNEGVKEVIASNEKQTVTIEYDQTKTTETKLKEIIKEEGYEVVK